MGETLQPGIETTLPSSEYSPAIRLYNGNPRSFFVRIEGWRNPSTWNTGKVWRARSKHEQGRKSLCPCGDWNGIILRVKTSVIRFSFPLLADNLNLWIGGDGESFASVGRGIGTSKDQLFVLKPGALLPVVDCNRRIGLISVHDGRPCVRAATAAEVANYVTKKAMADGHQRALDWAEGVVKALRQGVKTS